MRKNKKYIIIGIIVLSFITILFCCLNFNKKEIPLTSTKEEQDHIIKASLLVLDREYQINIKENSSVFDVMEEIKEENLKNNSFDFKYTNNESLGNFITSINGQDGAPGKYWIYYVNNKKASVGVSNYHIKDGDIINWVQEGI